MWGGGNDVPQHQAYYAGQAEAREGDERDSQHDGEEHHGVCWGRARGAVSVRSSQHNDDGGAYVHVTMMTASER